MQDIKKKKKLLVCLGFCLFLRSVAGARFADNRELAVNLLGTELLEVEKVYLRHKDEKAGHKRCKYSYLCTHWALGSLVASIIPCSTQGELLSICAIRIKHWYRFVSR